MPIDHSIYMDCLDGLQLTYEQKVDLIEVVDRMMEAIVDAAWGMDATQLALGTTHENYPDRPAIAVGSEKSHHSTFNDAAS
jgi:hypothetical protein